MTTTLRTLALSALAGVSMLLAGASARADATVQVSINDWVNRGVDAKVTMIGPKTLSCITTAARCSIKAPAGKYAVLVTPRRNGRPIPRLFTIPSSGTAQVVMVVPEKHALPEKNLGTGSKLIAKGTIKNSSGSVKHGVVIAKKGTTVLGYSLTKDGKFPLYDVSSGELTFVVWVYGAKSAVTVKAKVPTGGAGFTVKLP